MFGKKVELPPAPAVQTQFRIIIDYNAVTGQIKLDGAITNKMLAYGMLKLAEECVSEFHRKTLSSVVTKVGV